MMRWNKGRGGDLNQRHLVALPRHRKGRPTVTVYLLPTRNQVLVANVWHMAWRGSDGHAEILAEHSRLKQSPSLSLSPTAYRLLLSSSSANFEASALHCLRLLTNLKSLPTAYLFTHNSCFWPSFPSIFVVFGLISYLGECHLSPYMTCWSYTCIRYGFRPPPTRRSALW
jgi:hypothetical protein